jgi:hypothetical protein
MRNVPSFAVTAWATSLPDASWIPTTAPATGRGAHAGSGGTRSTGHTGPAVAVPSIPVRSAAVAPGDAEPGAVVPLGVAAVVEVGAGDEAAEQPARRTSVAPMRIARMSLTAM